jgi:hypothetical protein
VEPSSSSAPQDALSFTASVRELGTGIRGLLADEADLLAAEAQVAMHSVIASVIFAVAAAVFAVLAVFSGLGVFAFEMVGRGLSWPVSLAIVALACVAICVFLLLALKSAVGRRIFVASRRQLRGQN